MYVCMYVGDRQRSPAVNAVPQSRITSSSRVLQYP